MPRRGERHRGSRNYQDPYKTQSAPRIPLRYSINVGNELRAVLILTPIVPFVRCSLAENKRQIYERIKQRPRRAVVNGLRDNGGRAYKKKKRRRSV